MFTFAAGEFMLVFISCSWSTLVATFFLYALLLRRFVLIRMFSALPHNIATNHLIMRSRARTPFSLGELHHRLRGIPDARDPTRCAECVLVSPLKHPSTVACNERGKNVRCLITLCLKKKLSGKPQKKVLTHFGYPFELSSWSWCAFVFAVDLFPIFSGVIRRSPICNYNITKDVNKLFRIEAYRSYDLIITDESSSLITHYRESKSRL